MKVWSAMRLSAVFGVAAMSEVDAAQGLLNKLRKHPANRGVKIKYQKSKLIIELHIIVNYGTNISAIVKSIIHKGSLCGGGSDRNQCGESKCICRFYDRKIVKRLGRHCEQDGRSVKAVIAGIGQTADRLPAFCLQKDERLRECFIKVITGQLFRDAFISGANHITNHKQEVDELNVFPVPDGDTGTNMSMTINAKKKRIGTIGISNSVTGGR